MLITGIALLVGAIRYADPLASGLTATYFPDDSWSSRPAMTRVEAAPSTEHLATAWPGYPPSAFSATWAGSIVTLRTGRYTFATDSDDGSWLYVDGRLVVDNGGRHASKRATGVVDLERGVHQIFIKYFQDGGAMAVGISWTRRGGTLAPIPEWALSVRQAQFSRTLASVVVRRAATLMLWLWAVSLVVASAVSGGPPLTRLLRRSLADPYRRTLASVLLASAILDSVALWWGLPSGWVGDEIDPTIVFGASSAHFSNGWFDRYPPLLFYVLSAVQEPVRLLRTVGWISLAPATGDVVLFVLGRLVGVVAAAGTLVAVYACGARAFGRRAGLAAAAVLALLTPFVFYAKTANPDVPYVFWFALSLLFCARAIETRAGRDIAMLAVTATAAVCTKDQAFAMYLPIPFVLVWTLWRANRDRGVPAPLARAVLDRRLWTAAVAGVALFVLIHNIPFNRQGFISHLRYITGPGRGPYRVFEPTIRGEWLLLAMTVRLDQRSWGWPFFVLSLYGAAIVLRDPARRRFAIVLALLAFSYYAAFIAVLLYDYDRYLLPIGVIQALWAGVAIDALLAGVGGAAWRRGLVLAAFAYTAVYAATADVLMLRDSRYAAERWLDAHAGHDRLVGAVFPVVVLPRMDGFAWVDIGTVDNLKRWQPEYFVLNADYARAAVPGSPPAQLVAGLQQGTLGYHRVFRHRTPSPWPWLPGGHPDLVGPRLDVPVFSFLRDINPTIEIYAKN